MTRSLGLCLTAFLFLIAALVFMALLGPAVTQILSTASFPSPSNYQQDDIEGQIDLMLESYTTANSHGMTKHADVYTDVVNACQNPSFQLWVRPSKRVDVCMVDGLGWGFRVLKKIGGNGHNAVWEERTAYIREEIQCLDDLIQFANDNGLTLKTLKDGVWTILN